VIKSIKSQIADLRQFGIYLDLVEVPPPPPVEYPKMLYKDGLAAICASEEEQAELFADWDEVPTISGEAPKAPEPPARPTANAVAMDIAKLLGTGGKLMGENI
jgi:hypothetical protein